MDNVSARSEARPCVCVRVLYVWSGNAYCRLHYIELKCVDYDSRQSGIAANGALPVVTRNALSHAVIPVARINNIPLYSVYLGTGFKAFIFGMSLFYFLITIICLQLDAAIKVVLLSHYSASVLEIIKKPRGSVWNWNPIFLQHAHTRLPALSVLI